MLSLMKTSKREIVICFMFLIALFVGACGNVTSVPIETVTVVPNPLSPTPSITPSPIPAATTPSPLPTRLTALVTLDQAQAKQQDEIKSVLQAYFDLRYQVLSVFPPEDFQSNGFGDLVSDGSNAKDFLITEMAKLSVQRKWYELNRLR